MCALSFAKFLKFETLHITACNFISRIYCNS